MGATGATSAGGDGTGYGWQMTGADEQLFGQSDGSVFFMSSSRAF